MYYPSHGVKILFLLIISALIIPSRLCGQVATHLVISQAFGGGGITAGLPNQDFVELYNPTSSAVSVAGWSMQYALGTGTGWSATNLSGTVPAHGYFLIGLASNNLSVGTPIPTPDLTGITNMGSVNVKVGLVNSTTLLTGANPSASASVVDFVGTGTANGFLGTGAAPAGSNTMSWLRQAKATATAATMAAGGADATGGNGWDANNSATDFVTETSILARNSSTIVVLPVVFTGVQAFRQDGGIRVDWNVAEQIGIDQYIVERSTDGTKFDDVAGISANANSQVSAYTWTDDTPAAGTNIYYRIKAVELSQAALYSVIVVIDGNNGNSGIAAYPNPVSGGTIFLALNNQPPGEYTVTLVNLLGQELYKQVIQHAGGSETQQLIINALTVKGFYSLSVRNGRNLTHQALICR